MFRTIGTAQGRFCNALRDYVAIFLIVENGQMGLPEWTIGPQLLHRRCNLIAIEVPRSDGV